jgi:cobalt/nickel transport system permease protein
VLNFDKEYFNIGYLDTLAYKNTFVHRLDPRVKLVTTIVFVFMVVSFPKYELSKLIPFFVFPVFMAAAGEIPAGFILKKLLFVSPFVLFVAILNPVFDTAAMYNLYGFKISGGWVSCISIMIRFTLTISAALLLVATTSFPGVCRALERLYVPKVFVVQLFFLYRYLFVLAEETMRIVRAINMRTFGKKRYGIKIFISTIGLLFMKTVERSERIYHSMCSRGFNGEIRLLKKDKTAFADIVFAVAAISIFIIFRRYDITKTLGELAL